MTGDVTAGSRPRHLSPRPSVAPTTNDGIEDLLEKLALCESRQPTFVGIGGLYLDLRVHPVDHGQLEEVERSGLEPIEVHLGGSAYFMTRFLNDVLRARSTLISVVSGAADPLSALANEMINREVWIDELGYVRRENTLAAPVSVHLEDSSHGRTSTFTHRGALEDFGWTDVVAGLRRIDGSPPNVICIMSYFRTRLQEDLKRNLRNISEENIVAMDLGRWAPNETSSSAKAALLDAVSRGYVDLYFATPREFQDLFDLNFGPRESSEDLLAKLQKAAADTDLPAVTIVRDKEWRPHRPMAAYLLMEGSAWRVELPRKVRGHESRGGSPKNAFNAAFLYHLVLPRPGATLARRVDEATTAALKAWVAHS